MQITVTDRISWTNHVQISEIELFWEFDHRSCFRFRVFRYYNVTAHTRGHCAVEIRTKE